MTIDKPQLGEALCEVLNNETKLYCQLIDLTAREQTALTHDSLADLSEVTRAKETCLAHIQLWEQTRQAHLVELTRTLKIPEDTPLVDIIRHFDDDIAQQLLNLRQEFATQLEQLLLLNHANKLIIQTNLDRTEATIEHITMIAMPDDKHYSDKGGNVTPPLPQAGRMLNWEA